MAWAPPWTWIPGACTMVPVWIWWVASAAAAPQDTLACAVKQTSMNVVQVPAMQHIPGTAFRTQAGASTAFVMLASQVSTSMGEEAGLGSCLCSPLLADPCAPACPGPRCQTVLSPCESQPCQHGGQCRPSPGPGGALTFSCHCVLVGGGGGQSRQGLWERREHGLMWL